MTREEAKTCLIAMKANAELLLSMRGLEMSDVFDVAIEALSAEPCEDATLKDIFCMGCEYKEQEPCEDAISRQAVLDKLENLDWQELYLPIHFKRILDGLPSVKPKQKIGQWIPVSEGLPKDRREVFVTAYWHETYQVMMGSYYGDGLWWCVPFNNCGEHMQRLKPIAWMPLFLEPYKAESED